MAKKKDSDEATIRTIRRMTRKKYTADDMLRIVLEGATHILVKNLPAIFGAISTGPFTGQNALALTRTIWGKPGISNSGRRSEIKSHSLGYRLTADFAGKSELEIVAVR